MTKEEIEKVIIHVPEHSRNNCSDDGMVNAYTTTSHGLIPRCNRCALLQALKDERYAEKIKVHVVTEVTVYFPDPDFP